MVQEKSALQVRSEYVPLLEEAQAVIPVDYIVHISKVVFEKDSYNRRLVERDSKGGIVNEFVFDKFSYSQFIKRLFAKSDMEFLAILDSHVEEQVVNNLIKYKIAVSKGAPRFLLRTTKNKEVFACLTDSYVPVNHYTLMQGFLNVVKAFTEAGVTRDDNVHKMFQSSISYRQAIIRIPIHKISDEGKGIYTGLEFRNAQDGTHRLTIRMILFELVCTNGMVGTVDEFVYLDRPHRGRWGGFSATRLVDWYEEQKGLMQNVYVKLIKIQVKEVDKFIEKLSTSTKYTEINQTVSAGILETLNTQRRIKNNSCRAYDIVSALTFYSQSLPDADRFALDETAYKLANNEWLNL